MNPTPESLPLDEINNWLMQIKNPLGALTYGYLRDLYHDAKEGDAGALRVLTTLYKPPSPVPNEHSPLDEKVKEITSKLYAEQESMIEKCLEATGLGIHQVVLKYQQTENGVEISVIPKTEMYVPANEHSQEGVLENAALDLACEAYDKSFWEQYDTKVKNQEFTDGSIATSQREQMRAAIQTYLAATPKPTEGWQPIATAPKDETNILIAGGVWWCEESGHETKQRPFTDSTVAYYLNNDFVEIGCMNNWHKPTHWQPLPAPPALNSEGD